MWVVRTCTTRTGKWTLRHGKDEWKGKRAEQVDEVRVLSNWRIMIWRARRPFLYKEWCSKPNSQHPIWILLPEPFTQLFVLPTPSSLPISPAWMPTPIPLSPLVLTWNAFGLNNVVQLLLLPMPLTQEGWHTLTPVLGWYSMPLPSVICIQPIPQLDTTPVSMRYYHQLPPIKWKVDDRLDLYQDVEQSDPSGRAEIQ